MDSVFNDHVFPKYKDQQVMKPQMHGFNDPTLRNFMLLDSSALVKDELKADRFDDEGSAQRCGVRGGACPASALS